MKLTNLVSASILALAIGLVPAAAQAKDHHKDHHRWDRERREHHREWAREHREHERRDWRREHNERAAMHRYDRDHHRRYAHTGQYNHHPNGWEQGRKTGWDAHNAPPRGDYRHGQVVAQRQPAPVDWHRSGRR